MSKWYWCSLRYLAKPRARVCRRATCSFCTQIGDARVQDPEAVFDERQPDRCPQVTFPGRGRADRRSRFERPVTGSHRPTIQGVDCARLDDGVGHDIDVGAGHASCRCCSSSIGEMVFEAPTSPVRAISCSARAVRAAGHLYNLRHRRVRRPTRRRAPEGRGGAVRRPTSGQAMRCPRRS